MVPTPPPPPSRPMRVQGPPVAPACARVVRASGGPTEVRPPPAPPGTVHRRVISSHPEVGHLRRTPPQPYDHRTWNSPWIISARLSAWAPRSSGTFSDAINSISTSASSDPLELDFRGFQGQLEISRGPWSLRGEKTYAGVSGTLFSVDGLPATRAGAEVDMDQTMLGYRFAPIPLGLRICGPCTFLSAELCAGARFYDLDIWGEAGGLTVRFGTSEVDPVVGLRFEVPLTPRWKITASGDVGGFGYGTDFSSMLTSEVEYRFNLHWSVQAGWRNLYVEKNVGTDVFQLHWDATLTGPTLGVKYTF